MLTQIRPRAEVHTVCKMNHTNWSLECGQNGNICQSLTICLCCWLLTLNAISMLILVRLFEIEWIVLNIKMELTNKKRSKKPSKNKMKSLRKPQIKISTTLKRCKYKLVATLFRSYESNWFSWSANIYTCILQYKPINSMFIPNRFYFCMRNVIRSVSLCL